MFQDNNLKHYWVEMEGLDLELGMSIKKICFLFSLKIVTTELQV